MGAGEVTGMKQTRTRALFATFFKIGAFTFGGGYAMVALLEHEFVEEKQWVTREEFLDMVAIAESTPGPMAVNSATYIGYKLEGVPGAAASTLAVCLPSFAVIYAISLFFDQFLQLSVVSSAFRGIQVCVVYLVLSAGLKMLKNLKKDAFSRAVDKLLGAEHIYILGVRSSSFLAGYLNFYLHLIFKNVTLVQSSAAGEIYEQLAHIGRGDVLVGISFPRYSKMAIHAVEFACRRGAEVVAITDSALSPLYGMAAVSLLAPCDMISFVDSMAAPLSLLNALILAVGQQRRDDLSATLADMEQVWSRYSIFGKDDE